MSPTPSTAIEIKVLDERLRAWGLPRYQTAMSAALDLHACLSAPLVLPPGSAAALVPSGIAVHMADPGLAAVVLPRSGAGHRKGLVLGNGTGLIDADYTGEILVSVWNRNAPGSEPVTIEPGERIAQLMFLPIVRVALREVDAFSAPSARGAAGFGSTG